jgi:Ca-activated chloride channel homolog
MSPPGQSQPPSSPPKGGQTGEMQQVGGAETASAAPADPALLAPLQKLDQLRESDSPIRLYQLMQQAENPSGTPSAVKKHNW